MSMNDDLDWFYSLSPEDQDAILAQVEGGNYGYGAANPANLVPYGFDEYAPTISPTEYELGAYGGGLPPELNRYGEMLPWGMDQEAQATSLFRNRNSILADQVTAALGGPGSYDIDSFTPTYRYGGPLLETPGRTMVGYYAGLGNGGYQRAIAEEILGDPANGVPGVDPATAVANIIRLATMPDDPTITPELRAQRDAIVNSLPTAPPRGSGSGGTDSGDAALDMLYAQMGIPRPDAGAELTPAQKLAEQYDLSELTKFANNLGEQMAKDPTDDQGFVDPATGLRYANPPEEELSGAAEWYKTRGLPMPTEQYTDDKYMDAMAPLDYEAMAARQMEAAGINEELVGLRANARTANRSEREAEEAWARMLQDRPTPEPRSPGGRMQDWGGTPPGLTPVRDPLIGAGPRPPATPPMTMEEAASMLAGVQTAGGGPSMLTEEQVLGRPPSWTESPDAAGSVERFFRQFGGGLGMTPPPTPGRTPSANTREQLGFPRPTATMASRIPDWTIPNPQTARPVPPPPTPSPADSAGSVERFFAQFSGGLGMTPPPPEPTPTPTPTPAPRSASGRSPAASTRGGPGPSQRSAPSLSPLAGAVERVRNWTTPASSRFGSEPTSMAEMVLGRQMTDDEWANQYGPYMQPRSDGGSRYTQEDPTASVSQPELAAEMIRMMNNPIVGRPINTTTSVTDENARELVRRSDAEVAEMMPAGTPAAEAMRRGAQPRRLTADVRNRTRTEARAARAKVTDANSRAWQAANYTGDDGRARIAAALTTQRLASQGRTPLQDALLRRMMVPANAGLYGRYPSG